MASVNQNYLFILGGIMKKIAFYGKGGIGKSTTASNISAALSLLGKKVCQIGCDPKNDSTRLLLGHICKETVLDKVRTTDMDAIRGEDIVHTGFNGITCVEAGGPEPGVGCAGRGIIVALQLLDKLKAVPPVDLTLYDVLGDVVCGGFAMPIREGYAEEIYIISSGELMSLYAANNIAKGIKRFASRGSVRLAGIIGNSRNTPGEKELLKEFARRLNTRLVAFVPRDKVVNLAENQRQTVLQYAPDSEQAAIYSRLAETIWNNTELSIPTPIEFEELEKMVAVYGTEA
jgi:nitrogenase iron protein NifH